MKFTHKGWFGICPVYFSLLDTDAPVVEPRYQILYPLMLISEWMYGTYFYLATAINPEYEPEWPLKITGEL